MEGLCDLELKSLSKRVLLGNYVTSGIHQIKRKKSPVPFGSRKKQEKERGFDRHGVSSYGSDKDYLLDKYLSTIIIHLLSSQ
jgi:hypothetical protein